MKKVAASLVMAGMFILCLNLQAQEIQFPVIKGYGGVYKVDQAKVFPDKNLNNKVLFDITKPFSSPDGINPGLEHVAMFVNLYALYGISVKDMTVEAVIHSDAIALALNAEKFREVTGHVDANADLIKQLLDSGVKIYVCSQSLMQNHYQPAWVNPRMILSAAALNVLVNDQLRGFALLSY